jgi:hypothetical protein
MLNTTTKIDIVDSVLNDLSHLHVDLDEAGGCYLVVKHAKGVEQKMLRVLTNSGLHKTSDVGNKRILHKISKREKIKTETGSMIKAKNM